jgi:hypothetical protein
VGGDSGPVKDRYRDSEDEENKISSWGKRERVAANDSVFRRVSRFAEKLLMDTDQQAHSAAYDQSHPVVAWCSDVEAISSLARAAVCICFCHRP